MSQRPPIHYTDTQIGLMWDRWQRGESLHQIARLFDRHHSSVRRVLAETGGIRPAVRHRPDRALTLAEREEISRALMAGQSIRFVAARLSIQPFGRPTVPWNRGRLIGQKLPLKLRDIFGIRVRLQLQRRTRDLALFNLAIDSKLRGCDLVALRVSDLARESGLGARAQIVQRKTGKTVQFELTDQTRRALLDWIHTKGLTREDYVFPSRQRPNAHLSTRQYARIVKRWTASAGLPPSDYGTHSMRRTKPTLIYRRTHNLRAIQLLLGHTKLESTVRYLGIEVEDALTLSEETEV